MNKMQIIILLGGLILAGLCLFLILSPFDIFYAYQHPKAICDDCNSGATSRWIWFGVWEAMVVIGTGVGIYSARKA